MWQDDQPGPFVLDDGQRVFAGQSHLAAKGRRKPLSVPRFPWYY
jgi:hypothetical protein